MGLKNSPKQQFSAFLVFFQRLCRNTVFFCRDIVFYVATENLVVTEFSLLRLSFAVATENFIAT